MIDDKIYKPIFITGIERSGSTIVARIMKACGAFTGHTTEMCENLSIKRKVDSYYRDVLNLPEFGQELLESTMDVVYVEHWVSNITKILQREGYSSTVPWVYKSHRIAQTWPLWNVSYPQAKYIIVRRRTGDIIDSCMKTGYMKAHATTAGWLGWVHHQEQFFIEMQEYLNCIEVWPERMVKGDFEQMREAVEWAGLEWNPNVEEMVGVLLKNSKQR